MDIKVEKIKNSGNTCRVGDMVKLEDGEIYFIVEEASGYIMRTFSNGSWLGAYGYYSSMNELMKSVSGEIEEYYSQDEYELVLRKID